MPFFESKGRPPPAVTVNLVVPDQVVRLLAQIAAGVQQLLKGQGMASAQFEALRAEVERNTTVDESVKALVTRLADQIAASKDDPAALQALADQLRSSNDSVAAAVAANTPADTGGGTGGGENPQP